jgi:hypothetical protein
MRWPATPVGTAQLRSNAVTSAKVKNRSLRAVDLSPSARVGSRGSRGPQGPPGEFIGTPEAWKPLALAGGWAPFDANHQQPGFRKDCHRAADQPGRRGRSGLHLAERDHVLD